MMLQLIKPIVRRVFGLRIPGNPVHKALAWEYRSRRLAWFELQRILYWQPMFESLCRRVGAGTRLEIATDSKLPAIGRVDIELGERVRLSARTTFNGARNAPNTPRISIGDDSYVGHRVVFMAGHSIEVGKHVLIASNALLVCDPGHPVESLARRTQAAPPEALGRIKIGDDAWLAYNVTVIGNVEIGEGAIVAANSVVLKDVPPYTVVGGNPARVIRELPRPETRGVVVPLPKRPFESSPDAPASGSTEECASQ